MLPIARHLRRQGAVQITRFSRPTIVNQRHLTCQSPRCQAQHSSPELEKQPKKGPLDRFKKSGSPTSKTEGEKSKTAPVRTILRQSADLPIRTRFAPSPTGYLHLGSLRTALFNNLVSAASNGGTFILRIEDTDQSRLVPDAEDRIREGLKWFGLSWDEGPDCGGPYGPYRQSERLPIYQEHVKTLLDKEHAYRCFCTSEQLAEQKRILHEAGQSSNYPGTCRSIAKEESDERSAKGESHVIRFKGSDFGTPKFVDAIYGPFQKKEAEEDFILMKTDGYPTYHFANVVDDYLMKITHVVRGEEWLISTPKHVALYQAFGWKAPTFAHLGLLNNDDGSKLSKRNDSANLSSYQAQGYSPMALQMWLANLGSSFIKSKHVPRTLRQVADLLSFRFTKGGIKLNFEKLDYFETQYRNAIIRSPEADLAESETPIFTTLILQPTVREALKLQNATASEFSGWSNAAWEGEKELVPLMAENTRQDYVEKVIRANQYGGKDDALRLIPQSPHYFYRPPVALYEACAKGLTGGEKAVLDALSAVCDERMWWQTDGGAVTTQEVQSQLPIQGIESKIFLDNVDAVTVHRVIRLVATGAPDVASQPSGTLLAILGHEEMKHRTALVKDLVSKADI